MNFPIFLRASSPTANSSSTVLEERIFQSGSGKLRTAWAKNNSVPKICSSNPRTEPALATSHLTSRTCGCAANQFFHRAVSTSVYSSSSINVIAESTKSPYLSETILLGRLEAFSFLITTPCPRSNKLPEIPKLLAHKKAHLHGNYQSATISPGFGSAMRLSRTPVIRSLQRGKQQLSWTWPGNKTLTPS